MARDVLLVSNGYAEDQVGLGLIRALRSRGVDRSIAWLPIVGRPGHLAVDGVRIIGPHWDLPSDGVNYGQWFLHARDILAGLLVLAGGQLAALRRCRRTIALTVVIGDYVGLAATALARIDAPLVYVWVCPAHRFPPFVKRYVRRHAVAIFARAPVGYGQLDSPTLSARFVGNPLLDTCEVTGQRFETLPGIPTLGVLPGRRRAARRDLPVVLHAVEEVTRRRKLNVLVALAPGATPEDFIHAAAGFEWPSRATLTHRFGDVLDRADIVVGLAATGLEQAVGMGRPVVTCWGASHARTRHIVELHAKIALGGHAVVTPPVHSDLAAAVVDLVDDAHRRRDIGERGLAFMGPRGGTDAIADELVALLGT